MVNSSSISTSSGYHTNPFSYSPNQDGYDVTLTEAFVNEVSIINEKMVKDFTNQTITNAAPYSSRQATLLPAIIYSNNKQIRYFLIA